MTTSLSLFVSFWYDLTLLSTFYLFENEKIKSLPCAKWMSRYERAWFPECLFSGFVLRMFICFTAAFVKDNVFETRFKSGFLPPLEG